MIRPPLKRIIRDLHDRDEDIATYAAMNVLRLKEIQEEEITELLPALRKATTHGSISVRFFSRKALNEVKIGMRRFSQLLAEEEKLREETRKCSWSDLLDGLLEAPTEHRLVVIDLLKDLDDPKILPPLLRFLGAEEDEFVIAEVIRILGLIGGNGEIPLLEKYLKHSDSRIRSNAVEAMEQIGGKAVMQSILPLLEDDDNRVKATVAKVLSQHGEYHVLAGLADMMRSVEVWMRESAIYALGFVPYRESVDLLLEALVDVNPDVRVKAVESLQRLHARRAMDYLQTMAVGGDASVSAAAQKALEVIRSRPKDHPHLDPEDAHAVEEATRKRHPEMAAQRAGGAAGGKAETADPAEARQEAEPAQESFAGRLFGRRRKADLKEAEQLQHARDDMLAELGKHVLGLAKSSQFKRPYLANYQNEVKKLRYLVEQKEAQRSQMESQTKKSTFLGFLRESVSFFTEEKQVDQRLDSLNSRLDSVYREIGRRIVDEYDPSDTDMIMMKGMPEAVKKMERQIGSLEA